MYPTMHKTYHLETEVNFEDRYAHNQSPIPVHVRRPYLIFCYVTVTITEMTGRIVAVGFASTEMSGTSDLSGSKSLYVKPMSNIKFRGVILTHHHESRSVQQVPGLAEIPEGMYAKTIRKSIFETTKRKVQQYVKL